jgi:hypothetical protein
MLPKPFLEWEGNLDFPGLHLHQICTDSVHQTQTGKALAHRSLEVRVLRDKVSHTHSSTAGRD